MDPWDELEALIAGPLEAAYPEGETRPSVIAGITPQLVPDAIVIRPDAPWISRGSEGRPRSFTGHLERYVAVCATRVADPRSSMAELYKMAGVMMAAASDAGWDWTQVGPITLDESTDTPLLVVSVGLTYQA